MDHKEYYEKICKPAFEQQAKVSSDAFEEILVEVRATKTEVSDIKKRLFVDNGESSIQSRLNKQDRTLKIWCWIVCIFSAAALTGLADVVITRLFP